MIRLVSLCFYWAPKIYLTKVIDYFIIMPLLCKTLSSWCQYITCFTNSTYKYEELTLSQFHNKDTLEQKVLGEVRYHSVYSI